MEFPSDLAGTLQRAVKLLANASGHAAVVSAPRPTGEHLHHIEFVRLRAGLVLIIFVLQSGLIQNRLVQIHKDLPNDRLQLLARYLNSKLEGLGLEEARKAILEDMEEERRSFEILWGESFGRSLVG